MFKLGDCTISLEISKQKVVTLSIAKYKLIASAEATKQVVWLRMFLKELYLLAEHGFSRSFKRKDIALNVLQVEKKSVHVFIK